MPLPVSPTNYGPPQLDFSALGDLGNNYFQGAEQRRKYDLARAFQNGIPRKADGTPDTQSMYEILAQHGAVDIPNLQDQADRNAVQRMVAPVGQSAAPQPAALAPQAATGAAVAPPQRQQPPGTGDFRSAPPAPQNEGALARNAEGGESLRTLATGLSNNADVSDIIQRYAQVSKINQDDPLTPEQEAKLRPLLAKSIAARTGAQIGAPPAAPQAPAAPAAANEAVANLLPPGFTDPKKAVDYLRTAADRILAYGGKHGEKLAQQYIDRANAIETTAFGAPANFERTAGGLRPTPGGPEDPATITAKTNAALKPIVLPVGAQLSHPLTGVPIAKNNSGLFSPEAIKTMVERYRAGDPRVLTNVGRGAQGSENLANFQDALSAQLSAEGLTGKDQAAAMANFAAQAAAAKTAAVRESNVETSVNEALATFPLAIQASKAVPRTDFVPLNKLVELVRKGTSSVPQGKFLTALQGAITAYSQAMSRTGTNSVHAQQSAEKLLSSVTSHDELVGRLEQMEQEMQAAKVAPELTRKAILDRISGRGGEGGSSTGRATTTAPAANDGWKVEEIK